MQIAAVVTALLVLVGCSQNRYDLGNRLSEEQLPDPEDTVYVTQLLAELGPPLRISATSEGYVLAWEHWQIHEKKLGFSLGFAGADAFSIDWGSALVSGEFLLLGFDRDHRLSDASFMTWNNVAGGGQSIQPLGGLVPLVDIDDLLEHMPHHRWGALSFGELPATLNSANRPDTGQNGIEQRGTPDTLGQRALEMN